MGVWDGISRIAIVGPGLLGGSFGLAARAAGFEGTRVGCSRSARTGDEAVAAGAVDRATRELAEAVDGAGLVVVAVPVDRMAAVFSGLSAASDRLATGALITDLGSTKAGVMRAAAERLGPLADRFVGSHPMAGATATGAAAARADLFRGRPVAVCEAPGGEAAAARVRAVWAALGSVVLDMEPEAHDAAGAGVSHLPHLAAVLCTRVAHARGGLALASTGYAGATRLAVSDPAMRTAILRENAAAIGASLDAFIAEAQRVRGLLADGDFDALEAVLRETRGLKASET